jgi:oligopeptide transport system substrate-binding protein
MDHKTFTFRLSEAKFSNGEPITAQHVLTSFARIFILKAGIGADIDYIAGSKKVGLSKNILDLGIRVINSKTVEFRLDRPSSLFFKHLATVDCAILPLKDVDEKLAQDETLVASGPFRLASRTPEIIKLVRWRADALDSLHPPDEVHLMLAQNSDPEKLFSGGLTDSFDNDLLSTDFIKKLKSSGWQHSVTEISRERFIIMNPGKVTMPIRQFLASRIDQEALRLQVPFNYLSPAFGLIPTGMPGGLERSDTVGYRKAIQAVSAPKQGLVTLTHLKNDAVATSTVNALKQAWDNGDFNIQFDPVDAGELLHRMFTGKFELILGSKGIDYPDGYSVLTYFKSGYESNYFHVRSAEIDADIEGLVTTFDHAEREAKYRRLQIKILEKFTVIPLFFGSPASGMWSPKVAKVPAHPMGLHTLPFETLEMRQ